MNHSFFFNHPGHTNYDQGTKGLVERKRKLYVVVDNMK